MASPSDQFTLLLLSTRTVLVRISAVKTVVLDVLSGMSLISFSAHPARQTADIKIVGNQCFMIFDFELLGRYKNKKTPYPDTAKVS